MIRALKGASAAAALMLVMTGQGFAQEVAGPYLAGRQAAMGADYETAARYYTEALARDRLNPALMEDVIIAQLALGEIRRALPVAKLVEAQGLRSQAAHLTVVADLLREEEYAAYLDRDPETLGVGPLVDGLLQAWALVGAGDVDTGLQGFDEIARQEGLQGFALYHKALARASQGDFAGAEATFSGDDGAGTLQTRRGIIARAEILSQLGRNADALAAIKDAFGRSTDPELSALTNALADDGTRVPFTVAPTPRDGIAEVLFSLAGALRADAGPNYTLLYGRVAHHLRPDHVDAMLMNAELLEEMGQYDLAIAAYKAVPADHPAFFAAELGRAEALRQAGKPDAAIEVLEQLASRFSELPMVHSTLGDLLRQQEDYAAAVAAYDRALARMEEGARSEWFLHYARAISHERLGQWPDAEADFRTALELNPGQPQVLNYLGYSLVEKKIKLDEALDMIERAVEASPDSGYIVDSLGWVLYRLGRYDEAVVHMERAVELMPIDPVVNDHLGDVYWAVDRKREAEFQWSRALSFIPDETSSEADPERIRRKLAVGLDAVLAEEGAPPLKVADDDG